jgi:hypothetical protein
MNTTAASTKLIHTSLPCVCDFLSRTNNTHLCPSVVNPNICLSHVMNNWLTERQAASKRVVLQLVRIHSLEVFQTLFYFLQMEQYKTNFPIQTMTAAADSQTIRSRNHRSLAEKFGITLSSDSGARTGAIAPSPVAAEEELNTYLGVQIQANTDLVAFWQVHLCCCGTINPALHTILTSALI